MTLLFIPAIFLFEYQNQGGRLLVRKIIIAGIGGAILFLPWFIHVFSGYILNIPLHHLSIPAKSLSGFAAEYNSIGNIATYLSPVLWIIMLLSVAWGLWKRSCDIKISSTWWLLILLATNPNWLNLPGAGAISNFAIFISVYIPAGIFIGAASAWLIDSISHKLHSRLYNCGYQFIFITLFLILCTLGIRSRILDLKLTEHTLFTRPDQRAVHWINDHLPRDAKFLVNSFFAYGGTSIVGSDGGWWLPLLTNRQTSLPPLNYGAEVADEQAWAAGILERNLVTGEHDQALEDQGGVFALIGSTGVGKTTSTAKLAAAFAAKHGASNLGLITLDAYRVAAHEQLRAYGRILGVPVHTAHDRTALEDLLDLLSAKKWC